MSSIAESKKIPQIMDELGATARRASAGLANTSAELRNQALVACSDALRKGSRSVLEANNRDIGTAQQRGLSDALQDRLLLDTQRIEAIAAGLEAVRDLPDPLHRILAEWERPNGLKIQRVSVPLGVIGMIYESRPNVTADAAGLCLKSGNAVILRGGSESFFSCRAIYECLGQGLAAAGIDTAAIQMVPTTDRDAVGYLLSSMSEYLDVVVPRGGKGLIRRVQQEARVPVIGHLEGICHVYLHAAADVSMAEAICVNAKMRRTGICGAAETVLVDRTAAERLIPTVVKALEEAGCEVRGDASVQALVPSVSEASEADWSTEYLDAIISVRVVDDIEQAARHIRQYGSGHTECIVSADDAAAERFFSIVDSAILLHNASTQYADGGEFGMGAEIGIATGRIHARGPVGAEQLTSYKYLVRGSGQTRP